MPDVAVSSTVSVRELTFGEAIREAIAEEMDRDPRVCLLGEDVAEAGTTFKVLKGLVERFGQERVIDTPISEAGFTGLGVGAAMAGLRPVVDIMFGDFLALIMDQLVNQAAKIHYMSGGKWKVPLVLRATMGAITEVGRAALAVASRLAGAYSRAQGRGAVDTGRRQGPSQERHSRRQPGGVLRRQDQLHEGERAGPRRGVHDSAWCRGCETPRAQTSRSSATSSMVQVALGAATMLESVGISAEVVDPRTLWPLDEATLIESVKKTSRCIVIDEGYARYGVTGELASVISEGAFYDLDGPVRRIGAMHVPIPFSPPLEDATVPTEQQVLDLARRMCNR